MELVVGSYGFRFGFVREEMSKARQTACKISAVIIAEIEWSDRVSDEGPQIPAAPREKVIAEPTT